jgi:hypothetical protein
LTCRLEDVLDPRWKLSDRAEPVEYRGDPRPNLIRHGATAEDLCFLVTGEQDGVWIGQRLELNAFTGPQFVEWLGERLTEEGVGKVLPDEETLALAWRRTHFLKRVEEASAKFVEEVLALAPPDDLALRVEEGTAADEDLAWDDVVVALVEQGDR